MANKNFLDKNGLLYFWEKILNAFVKKDGNKVLSDNNYTTEEKNKLAELKQAYVGEEEPTDESVVVWIKPSETASEIPTKTSDLINDSKFVTETDVNNAISEAVGKALEGSY